jgi:hypothetical protein
MLHVAIYTIISEASRSCQAAFGPTTYSGTL